MSKYKVRELYQRCIVQAYSCLQLPTSVSESMDEAPGRLPKVQGMRYGACEEEAWCAHGLIVMLDHWELLRPASPMLYLRAIPERTDNGPIALWFTIN